MWTEEKLNEYIKNKVEESIHLDYKGSGSLLNKPEKKKEISKDVSAFANSDGGIIIYGIREFDEKEQNHLPEKIDPVNRQEISKEWLEQVITSNIQPKIKGVKIIPISIDNSDEKVVYVVDIPKSNTAHQAKDKRYYKRYNFESIPIDDWEIKDIINRGQKPDVKLRFKPIGKTIVKKFFKIDESIEEFDVIAVNKGNQLAKYIDCFFFVYETDKVILNSVIKPSPTIYDDHFQIAFFNSIGTDVRVPLLPNTFRSIGRLKLKSSFIEGNHKMKVSISTEVNYKYFKIKPTDFKTENLKQMG